MPDPGGAGDIDWSAIQGEAEKRWIQDQVFQHKDLNFVQRLMSPDEWPRVKHPNGGYSTHRMAWTSVGNQHIVYPTVVYDWNSKDVKQRNPDEAVVHALQTGEYIPFNTPEQAHTFAMKYKRMWE